MNRSLALRLAALSVCLPGCYRYLTPAYTTVSVSASVPATVNVAYDEPMSRGVWLQNTDYGPVWLPSESPGSSSLWADADQTPRIGTLAWSPVVSQWVWLDTDVEQRLSPYVEWNTSVAPRLEPVVVVRGTSNRIRTIDDRFKL